MKKFLVIPVAMLLFACNQSENLHKTLADSLHMADTSVKPITKLRLIIPGKSIGAAAINGNADSITAKMGKPFFTDAAMGASLLIWHHQHKKNIYETTVYAHRNMGAADENISHIKVIRVTSPWYKTSDYAGAGSELKDVRKLFRLTMHPIAGYSTKQLALYSDYGAGISFEADSTGRCHAVWVYARGDSSATYISLKQN